MNDLPPQFREPARPPTPLNHPVAAPSVARGLYDRMVTGGEFFWCVVYEPFMARDITRKDVREVIQLGLQQTLGNYRVLVELFNMQADEYRRFLNFLRSFNCHLPVHSFTTGTLRAVLGAGESLRDDASIGTIEQASAQVN